MNQTTSVDINALNIYVSHVCLCKNPRHVARVFRVVARWLVTNPSLRDHQILLNNTYVFSLRDVGCLAIFLLQEINSITND